MNKLSDELRKEIGDFLNKIFHINIDGYSEEQINHIIIELNKNLDSRIKFEQQRCIELEKTLEQEKMFLDSISSNIEG